MYRHFLIKVNSKEIFKFLRVQFNVLMPELRNRKNFKEFCNVYFTKLLEDHRTPTNIDINETMDWKIRSKWNKFKPYM